MRERIRDDASFHSASVALVHAVSTASEGKLRAANVSERIIAACRAQCMRHAQGRMAAFAEAQAGQRTRVGSTIAHGDPAHQMLRQQQRSGADLIVVGKHPSTALGEFFSGSVAGRILGHARTADGCADVLVVPHDWQPASRTSAAVRLTAEQVPARRIKAGAPQPPCGPNPAAVCAGSRLRAAWP